jgi:hypothetical protein
VKIAVWLVLGSLVGIAWVRGAEPISNPDFGWHVAMGRWILEHGSVPVSEPFTHTARGAPEVAHQWLCQIGYAAIVDAFGVAPLRFANGLLAALVVGAVYATLRRAGAAIGVSLLACAIWTLLSETRFQLRPHMWNLLLFAALYGWLFVRRPRLSAAHLAGVFAVGVLWINLHSGAVLLPAVAILYAAAATFEQLVLGRTRGSPSGEALGEDRLTRLWALAGVASLAVLVSPSHFRIFSYVVESGRINADLSLEWASLVSARGLAHHGPLWLASFFGVVLAAAGIAWLRRRELRLAELAVMLFATALPFASQRFVWSRFVPLVFLATQWRPSPRIDRIAGLAAALLVVARAAALDPGVVAGRLAASSNFRPATFPVGAMTFLAEADLEGRLFNSNKWGGYVLFRTHEQYPIFIDGRWITIGEQVLRDSDAIAKRRPGYPELLDAYAIEILLVHRGWMTEGVRREGRWIPVFENWNSGVYLRPGPNLAANLERCRDYYARRKIPFDSETGFVERLAAEANPRWARLLRVQRRHLDQFGDEGARALSAPPRWVEGWP